MSTNSKHSILEAIRDADVIDARRPQVPRFRTAREPGLATRFVEAVEQVSGRVVSIVDLDGLRVARYETIDEAILELFPDAQSFAASRSGLFTAARIVPFDVDVRTLLAVDVFVCPAEVGVAENGAVWIADTGHPAAPFGAANLVVTLSRSNIVGDMHEAYRTMDVDRVDYGVFVSGPSKTADIEQSLVIGAHGPKTFTAVLI